MRAEEGPKLDTLGTRPVVCEDSDPDLHTHDYGLSEQGIFVPAK